MQLDFNNYIHWLSLPNSIILNLSSNLCPPPLAKQFKKAGISKALRNLLQPGEFVHAGWNEISFLHRDVSLKILTRRIVIIYINKQKSVSFRGIIRSLIPWNLLSFSCFLWNIVINCLYHLSLSSNTLPPQPVFSFGCCSVGFMISWHNDVNFSDACRNWGRNSLDIS